MSVKAILRLIHFEAILFCESKLIILQALSYISNAYDSFCETRINNYFDFSVDLIRRWHQTSKWCCFFKFFGVFFFFLGGGGPVLYIQVSILFI